MNRRSGRAKEPRPRILTARRAYEFRPDELRLSILSSKDVLDRVRERFSFQRAAIEIQPGLMGPVPPTLPPGLVFQVGAWVEPPSAAPVRMITFDAKRIVIDAVSESRDLDSIYNALLEAVGDLRLADGSPAIGEATKVIDMSELVIQFDGSRLLDPKAYALLGKWLRNSGNWSPRLQLISWRDSPSYPGIGDETIPQFLSLEVRVGAEAGEDIWYSQALCGTEEHRSLLDRLEKSLAP